MICLATATIIGTVLGGYLYLIRAQNVSVVRSKCWNSAMALAEAGVEEALQQLNPSVLIPPATNADLGANGWTASAGFCRMPNPPRTFNEGRYGVVYTAVDPPVIYSTGYVTVPISGDTVSRIVRVETVRDGLFKMGIIAKTNINLTGFGVSSDSYISSDPNYSTDGRYDPTKARANGGIAANWGLIGVQNAKIKGKLKTGPGGSVSIGPQGSVGDAAWVDGGSTGVKSGYASDDLNVDFPPVAAPVQSSPLTPVSGTYNGTNYTYILSSGDYRLDKLSMKTGDTMMVLPGAIVRLYVTGNVNMLGSSSINIAYGAILRMFVGGSDTTLSYVNNAGNAYGFQYYGLPSNTSLTFTGNEEFVGTIYAPSADMKISGGGNQDFDWEGAGVINSLTMNGHFHVHYDEDLASKGPIRGLVACSWREL